MNHITHHHVIYFTFCQFCYVGYTLTVNVILVKERWIEIVAEKSEAGCGMDIGKDIFNGSMEVEVGAARRVPPRCASLTAVNRPFQTIEFFRWDDTKGAADSLYVSILLLNISL